MNIIAILSAVSALNLGNALTTLSNAASNPLQNNTDFMKFLSQIVLKNKETKQKICTKYFENIKTQRIEIQTIDNIKINAYLLVPREVNNATVASIILHGVGSNREQFINNYCLYEIVNNFNIILLVPDYRDFGDSEGNFSIKGCSLDIDACCQFMQQILKVNRVNIIGFSFGAGLALEYINELTKKRLRGIDVKSNYLGVTEVNKFTYTNVAYKFIASEFKRSIDLRLVLLGSFSSVNNVVKYDLRIFDAFKKYYQSVLGNIGKYFCYDGLKAIKKIEASDVLLVHGSKDDTLSVQHSIDLAEESGAELIITDNDHGDLLFNESMWDRIIGFLKKY